MLQLKYAPSITRQQFLDSAETGLIPPVYAEINYASPAGLYPVFSGSNSFLLESAGGSEKIARYSFLGFEPAAIYKVKDGISEVGAEGRNSLAGSDPLARLAEILGRYKQASIPELPPFQGGAAGLLSYDFVRYIELLPVHTVDDLHIPDAHFLIIDRLIAFDHAVKKAWAIVCPGVRNPDEGWGAAYDEAELILTAICKTAENAGKAAVSDLACEKHSIKIIHEMKKETYMDMVRRARDYIAAGDIFQANLSQRVKAFIGTLDPWKLYMTLRSINPSPFAGFVNFGEYCIVSSSPERLVKIGDRNIETRPIAGTRPRGNDVSEDEKMRAELLLNEKERAEHIMLIDLERNDLGRVSGYGSVKADELMLTEDYSHVIHIVSNIRGELAQGKTCLDVIRAVFPGGTITGVPKVRCMEIIDELEPVRRGAYTGSMGYIGFSGAMDFNIVIRTFVIKDGYAYVQAGAGIVADSEPEREYYETLRKAEALIKTMAEV